MQLKHSIKSPLTFWLCYRVTAPFQSQICELGYQYRNIIFNIFLSEVKFVCWFNTNFNLWVLSNTISIAGLRVTLAMAQSRFANPLMERMWDSKCINFVVEYSWIFVDLTPKTWIRAYCHLLLIHFKNCVLLQLLKWHLCWWQRASRGYRTKYVTSATSVNRFDRGRLE